MKNKTLMATLLAGGLLTLGPALFAADTNTPPANAPTATAPAAGPGAGGGFHGGRMGPNIEQISKDLSLNDDQTAKFKSIMESTMQKRRDLFQDNSLSREDKMAKMKTIQDDVDAQMKKLLTPEQYDKWQKMPHPGMRRLQKGGDQAGGAGGDNKPANPQE